MKISEWRLRLNENVESTLNRLRSAADKTSQKFEGMQSKLNNVGNSLGNKFTSLRMKASDLSESFGGVLNQVPLLGSSFSALISPIGAVVAVVGALAVGLISAINLAAPFQDKVAEFSAITGTVGASLDYVHDKALEMSAATGKSAVDVIDAYKLVASNVPPALQQQSALIDQITKNSIVLQKASGAQLSDAVLATTNVMNAFKIEATDTARIINVLAAGAQKGAAEVPDLIDSLRNSAPIASQAKVSFEELVASIEVLSPIMKGAMADTAIKNILIDLQTKFKGVDLQTNGLAKSLQGLKPHLNDAAFLAKAFGDENLAAAQYLIANSDAIAEMNGLITGTNTAFEQAAIRDQTYIAAKERMTATWDMLKIKIGEQFLPVLTRLADSMSSFFNWIDRNSKTIGQYFEVIWAPMEFAIKVIIGFVENAVGAFQFLFDKLKTVGIHMKGVWNVFYGFVKSIVDLVSGTFVHVAEIINPVNWFKKGKVKESINELRSTFVDFGKSAGNGFVDGMESETKNMLDGAASKTPQASTSSLIGSTGAVLTTTTEGGTPELKKGLTEVSGGGKTVRNVTITIQKMVDGGIHVHSTTVKEGATNIREIIQEELLRAIQGSEMILINE